MSYMVRKSIIRFINAYEFPTDAEHNQFEKEIDEGVLKEDGQA